MVDHRARVLLYLHLLGSPESTRRLGVTEDTEAAAMELCRLWIEEIYVPGIRALDGLKGQRETGAVRLFEASFSERESELLHQFHRFMELRLQMFPKRLPEEQVFPHGEFWQNIFRHARNILQEIDPDGLELDSVLARSGRLDGTLPGFARLSEVLARPRAIAKPGNGAKGG